MRNLLLGSFFLAVICSCSPRLYQNLTPAAESGSTLQPIFSKQNPSFLYKAKIDILTHYLSGLLFIKPTGVDTFRVVFTNELGLKFFDLELYPNGKKVHYAMEKLDKKVVLNTLEKDLKLFLMTEVDPEKTEKLKEETNSRDIYKFKRGKDFYYYVVNKEDEVVRIENTSKSKVKVEVELRDYKNDIPYFINIKHHNFKFNIELNYLER